MELFTISQQIYQPSFLPLTEFNSRNSSRLLLSSSKYYDLSPDVPTDTSITATFFREAALFLWTFQNRFFSRGFHNRQIPLQPFST